MMYLSYFDFIHIGGNNFVGANGVVPSEIFFLPRVKGKIDIFPTILVSTIMPLTVCIILSILTHDIYRDHF